MKPHHLNRWLSQAIITAAFITCGSSAMAQSGTWTGTGSGPNNWSASAQWSGATVANGASNTATFNSNITQLTVVTLDSTRTIGNMTFSDNAAGGSPWLLRGTNTLTMNNGVSQAVITKTTTTTLSTPIAGSNIRINGGASMNITGNNTGITGTLTLGGINGVYISNSNGFGTASITLAAAEVLGGTTNGIAIANNLTFYNTYYQGAFGLTLNGTLALTGSSQGFQTFVAITDTVQAGSVNLGVNNLNVGGGAVGGLRISGNISGTGGVAKSGSSALSLSGANSYTGATNVTAGRLNFNSSANTSDLAVTGTGTILAGEGSSSNAITLNAGSVLAVDPSTPAALSTTAALSILSSLTSPTTVTLALEPTQAMATGTTVVDVIKYGTFTGTDLANLTLPTGIRSGVLADDTVNSKITLSLETGTRTWAGNAVLTDWDALSTENWLEGDKKFGVGDSVVFDDTAAVAGSIFVVGKLTPASVTFNNSAVDYTLVPVNSTANANQITGGTSLVKSGTGLLTITNTNSYTGGTSIDAGTLSFVNGGLGTYGNITLNGGTLKWEGSNTQDVSSRLALVNGKAAIFDVGGISNVSFNTTLGGSTATTASVIKNGTGTLTLNNSFSPGTYTGGTTVNSGTLSLGTGGTGNVTCSPAALGTGTVTINSGARVRLWVQNTQTHDIANNFVINGGRLHCEDGIYNVNGTVSVASGGATFSAVWGGKNLYMVGAISGTGPVTVEATSSQVRFLTNNTYTGPTTISSGSLVLNGTQASSGYTVASGASLFLRTTTFSGNITGPGNVSKDISTFGASTISGANNNYTGTTIVNLDRFTLGSGGVINGTSSITVLGQFAAQFENLGTVTTPGALTVNGSSSASDGLFNNGNNAGTTPGSLTAASITLQSSFISNATSPAHGGEFNNRLNSTVNLGTGAITVNGQGNSLAGGSTATGSRFSNAGTVTAGSITLNSSSTANTVSNRGGTFTQTAGTTTLTSAITLAANGGSGAAGTAGNDAVLNLSGGTLTLPTLALNSGTLNATGGTLTLGSAGLTSSGANSIAANLGSTTLSASTAWSSSVPATLTDATTGTTVNTTGGNITLSGVLSGTGKLVKAGSGTLILSGANTYTGSTTVIGGTLGGIGAAASALTVNSGASLAPGAGIGTFSCSASTLVSGSTFTTEINSSSATSDLLLVTGAVDLQGASLTVTDLASATVTAGTKFTLIDYTGGSLTGTFNGLAQGASMTVGGNAFTISYTDASKVTLTVEPPAGYSNWANLNANDDPANVDTDGDGVLNGVEYFMGQTGSTFTPTPALIDGKVTWPKDPAAVATYVIQTSVDLSTWNTATSGVVDNGTSVEYTVPTGDPARFARIKVTTP